MKFHTKQQIELALPEIKENYEKNKNKIADCLKKYDIDLQLLYDQKLLIEILEEELKND